MVTISILCREFNLSRSTLLYYDKINLLKPIERTHSKYRLYSDADKNRLKQICAYREAGISLDQIKDIIDSNGIIESRVLEKRVDELNKEIRFLRFQQKIIIEMLKTKNEDCKSMLMDKRMFVSILKAAGLDDEMMEHLHVQFEKNSPETHQFFLEFLGIPLEEIKLIRDLNK
jgi:DNA-binding transcriptional MerR regulator